MAPVVMGVVGAGLCDGRGDAVALATKSAPGSTSTAINAWSTRSAICSPTAVSTASRLSKSS